MDLIQFNQRAKHGTLDFHPRLVYGFEDPDAGPYFKACGWADDVADDLEPDVIITLGELDIDPLVVFGHDHDHLGRKAGQFVMPERAAAKLRETHPHVTDEWAQNYTATFVPGADLAAQIEAQGHI